MAKKLRAETILIIEDDDTVQKFISRVLELEGYGVIKADSGEKGMDIIRKPPPSLVLLDLRLPGRDGWSVLREIKNDPELAPIPVVVLTAVAEAVQREKTLRMGAAQYLTKPLSAGSVAASVSLALKQRAKHPASHPVPHPLAHHKTLTPHHAPQTL
jgi:DNA-binding response OmpR family regulator